MCSCSIAIDKSCLYFVYIILNELLSNSTHVLVAEVDLPHRTHFPYVIQIFWRYMMISLFHLFQMEKS